MQDTLEYARLVLINERSNLGPLLTVLIVVTTELLPCIEYSKVFRVSPVLLKSRTRHALITNLGYIHTCRVRMKHILRRKKLQQAP